MKNHDRIQNQLSAYLDNELSPEQRTIVETHLSECHECADMLADFQRNRQWIGALTHEAPPIADTGSPTVGRPRSRSTKIAFLALVNSGIGCAAQPSAVLGHWRWLVWFWHLSISI